MAIKSLVTSFSGVTVGGFYEWQWEGPSLPHTVEEPYQRLVRRQVLKNLHETLRPPGSSSVKENSVTLGFSSLGVFDEKDAVTTPFACRVSTSSCCQKRVVLDTKSGTYDSSLKL